MYYNKTALILRKKKKGNYSPNFHTYQIQRKKKPTVPLCVLSGQSMRHETRTNSICLGKKPSLEVIAVVV